MKYINVIKHLNSKWGLNKTVTIIGLNVCAMGFATCIGVNVIPDKPEEIEDIIEEEKENN